MGAQLRDTTTTTSNEPRTTPASAASRASAAVSIASATPVRLTGRDVDFGDGDMFNDEPIGFGLLTWETTNGSIKPRLKGKLYLKSAMGVTARMQMRYFDVHGNVLTTQVGAASRRRTTLSMRSRSISHRTPIPSCTGWTCPPRSRGNRTIG